MNTFATNPTLAQQQANRLNGNALKSLDEMSDAVTHEVWYFAGRTLERSTLTATAARKQRTKSYRFKYNGHQRARTR